MTCTERGDEFVERRPKMAVQVNGAEPAFGLSGVVEGKFRRMATNGVEPGIALPPMTYNGPMERRGQGRKKMEERYGQVDTGAKTIEVRGVRYRLREVLARWMMDVPEIMTLEGGTLGEDRHWIRFIDKDDRTYVVFEFNGDFDILSEMRVDSLEWEGEDFFGSRWR
jgi:hypothetical protein